MRVVFSNVEMVPSQSSTELPMYTTNTLIFVAWKEPQKRGFMSTQWCYHKDHFSIPQMCPWGETMTAAFMLRAVEIREAWCPIFKSLQNSFYPRMPTFPNRWKRPKTIEFRWSLLLVSQHDLTFSMRHLP